MGEQVGLQCTSDLQEEAQGGVTRHRHSWFQWWTKDLPTE